MKKSSTLPFLLFVQRTFSQISAEGEHHPDINNEDYPGMIYVGRMYDDGSRVGFEKDNGLYSILFVWFVD